jgi:hypothetical protein
VGCVVITGGGGGAPKQIGQLSLVCGMGHPTGRFIQGQENYLAPA